MQKPLLLILFLLMWQGMANANPTSRIEKIYGKPLDSLWENNFPYEVYISQVAMTDIEALAADAQHLDSLKGSSLFFSKLFLAYDATAPLVKQNEVNLLKNIELGSQLLNHRSFVLQDQGDRILQNICQLIEQKTEQGIWDFESEEVQKMVAQLKKQAFLVKPPIPSDSDKIVHNIKQGKFDYIIDKFYAKCFIDCPNGECGSICTSFFIGSVLATLAILFFSFRLVRRRWRKNTNI